VATWSGGILAVVPGVEGVATDINDRGDVVGRHTNAVGERRAFRLTAGTAAPVDLGTLGGNSSEALAVNGRGVIVGTSNSPAGPRAFVLDGGAMQDLNSLVVSGLPAGHVLQVAYDVNDAGQIVGLYQASAIGPNYPYRLDPVAVAQSPAEVPALAPGALAGLAVLLVAATAALRRRPR
jgi:probable HAF family extracellular repeat protein